MTSKNNEKVIEALILDGPVIEANLQEKIEEPPAYQHKEVGFFNALFCETKGSIVYSNKLSAKYQNCSQLIKEKVERFSKEKLNL